MPELLDRFLSLRCSGDVLNAVAPLNRAAKEITESMAMFLAMRSQVLESPMKYTLWDLCAGNALTGILAAHVLPFKEVVSIDRKPRRRPGHAGVTRWSYLKGDIDDPELWKHIRDTKNSVVSATHPCAHAETIALQSVGVSGVYIMPCCLGNMANVPPVVSLLADRITKYELWCLYLAARIHGDCKVYEGVLSPKNIIVWRTSRKMA
jgi:hypothetical protein